MKLFLGSDHAGFLLKSELFKVLQKENLELIDCGCFSNEQSVDYPDIAFETCKQAVLNKARAVLFCGTGVGMAMAANKVDGIRAVCGVDCFSVKFSRQHNDANVLCLGGRVVGTGLAAMLVKLFLATEFEGERHLARIKKLKFHNFN